MDVIVDRLTQGEKYYSLHPAFPKAFAFLSRRDLSELEPGKYEIENDRLFCIIHEGQGLGKNQVKLEAHQKYIDLQYVISGTDEMGWKPVALCTRIEKPYDSEKDIVLFGDAPEFWIRVGRGSFVLFFPDHAHAALGGTGTIRRAIVKIAVDWKY